MHLHLTPALRYGLAAVPGLLLFTLLVIPELRWQFRNRPGCLRDRELWFWVAILVALCFGFIPYLLLHVVTAG